MEDAGPKSANDEENKSTPTSVLTVLSDTPNPPKYTWLALTTSYMERVYYTCCSYSIFNSEGALPEDGWNVVVSTQALVMRLLPELCSPSKTTSATSAQFLATQSLEVRQHLAAIVVIAMCFAKGSGLVEAIFSPDCKATLSGATGLYFECFLTQAEKRQVASTFAEQGVAVAGPALRAAVDANVIRILNSTDRVFQILTQTLQQRIERKLWQVFENKSDRTITNFEQLKLMRGAAVFFVRAAFRSSTYFSTSESSDVAAGGALAAVCAVRQLPTTNLEGRLPNEKARGCSCEFLRMALTSEHLYTGPFATGSRLYELLKPEALQRLLTLLRCSQPAR